MPRPKSGNPPLRALAVKLPDTMIEEVKSYADLHGMSISELIREGIDMRLHGTQQAGEYNGNTLLSSTTAMMLSRLATTLANAADQLRSASAGAMVPEREEPQYNSNTTERVEEYNGNTIHPVAPRKAPEESQSSEVCPPFDPTKNALGRLCPQKHEWGKTGQTLRRLPNQSCRACENAAKRQRRAAKH